MFQLTKNEKTVVVAICDSREEAWRACTFGIDQLSDDSRQLEVRVYLNPSRAGADFRFIVSDLGRVTLKIYDIHGREVVTVIDKIMTVGEHEVRFDTCQFAPGIYHYRISGIEYRQAGSGEIIL